MEKLKQIERNRNKAAATIQVIILKIFIHGFSAANPMMHRHWPEGWQPGYAIRGTYQR
jgi:hypothetical protein